MRVFNADIMALKRRKDYSLVALMPRPPPWCNDERADEKTITRHLAEMYLTAADF